MNLTTSFMTILLVLGLVLPPLAGANESVKSSIDEKGTIHIGTGSSAEKAKAGEKAGVAHAQPGSATLKQAVPAEPPPPGLMPPSQARRRGSAVEARRKAFQKAHPELVPARPQTPAPQKPAPKEVPQDSPQPAQPLAPESR
jgi:hypothetical protein